jgi:hypothetical protein
MPCYITKTAPASHAEYESWKALGMFSGSYEAYLRIKSNSIGSRIFICGDLGEHCADCSGFGDFLCDYPVGDSKTCDRLICADHAHEISTEIHYCDTHYKMWVEFRNSGGVDEALKNVIAFKSEK